MKNTIKKVMSYALLPAFLGLNYGRASEYTEKIELSNSEIVFSYEQVPSLKIGLKELKERTNYLVNPQNFIVKPDFGIDKVIGYLDNQSKYYETAEGKKNINDKKLRLRNLKSVTNDVSDAGLEAFVNAAKNGVITEEEYKALEPGDVYITERIEDKYGAIDRGVIVRKPGYVISKSGIEEEVIEREEFAPEKKKIEAVKVDKEEFGIIPIKEEENWCERHPVKCGLAIGAGAALLGIGLRGKSKEHDQPAPNPSGTIGGGNEF